MSEIDKRWEVYHHVCKNRFDELYASVESVKQHISTTISNGLTSKMLVAEQNAKSAKQLAWWTLGTLITISMGLIGAMAWVVIRFAQYVGPS